MGLGVAPSARQIVLAWMNSPDHKRNLLDPSYRQAGLAVAAGSPVDGLEGPVGTYTNDFGRRSR